ncbi:MAG: hypothetical protein HW374_1278 [Bacteroidetes bacterium]|nr:hypothetical protein [Bacteroidota bacterium]
MKRLTLFLLLTSGSLALAHPGVGIVMDSRGNVYYTDLKHVWKLTPDGTKGIAVRNVHTHELYLDHQDNLYGEHLWYEGDATKKWGHRVWRLSANGTLSDIISARQGFLDDFDDFHFVHDRHGNMYWADRGDSSFIRKRSPGGAVTTLASGKFRNIRWMTATADGTVYFVDMHDLISVSPNGVVRTVVRNLAERQKSLLFFNNEHAIMGLWTDSKENVYAAVSADQLVKRISPEGSVDVVARSMTPWSPTGGLVAPNGDLWLLEDASLLGVRARKVGGSHK